jgi:two-component system, OmpR family, phosphate regulon sensor histidine kinase PhoR
MFSFRQKLFLSYLALFLLLFGGMYAISGWVVRRTIEQTLFKRTQKVLQQIDIEPSQEAMIKQLETLQHFLFFGITLFNQSGEVVYDTWVQELGAKAPANDPEVEEAYQTGEGYAERYSDLTGQDLAYVALAFPFQGETYVLRTAFAISQVIELADDFRISFLTVGTILLILFAVFTSVITHHFSRPINKIIRAIQPYQEGREEHLPQIELPEARAKRDEFGKLAYTLNSLSERIESHIQTLTNERNERASILDSLVEGVVAVDTEGVVIYANAMALRLLKRNKEGCIGYPFPKDQNELYNLLAGCQAKRAVVRETFDLSDKGKRLYLDVVAIPRGLASGAILVLQDQTNHYALLEMRKEFIANASHELKTPLTIIHGFSEALYERPEMEPEVVRDIMEKISRNCDRMEKLVKNLLRLADIEHLPLANLQKIDLVDFMEECKEMTLAAYPDATVDVVIDTSRKVEIQADSELLELALTNILFNAAKYSSGPAEITLAVKALPARSAVQITVADKGIGIPAEDLPHIFRRFYTVDKAHSRKLGGSGLGLSIVETIVQKHFGEISVQSELGVGTKFTIILPTSLRGELS